MSGTISDRVAPQNESMTRGFTASIRVISKEWSPAEVGRFLGVEGHQRPVNGRVWVFDLKAPEVSKAMLEAVVSWIDAHSASLRSLPSHCAVELYLGWAPRTPQDHLTFSAELVAGLAAARAKVQVETYGH